MIIGFLHLWYFKIRIFWMFFSPLPWRYKAKCEKTHIVSPSYSHILRTISWKITLQWYLQHKKNKLLKFHLHMFWLGFINLSVIQDIFARLKLFKDKLYKDVLLGMFFLIPIQWNPDLTFSKGLGKKNVKYGKYILESNKSNIY